MPAKKKTATQPTHVAEAPTETPAPKSTEVKLGAAKGRPMLQWVGKKPLSRVTAFPAQLVETFDPGNELASASTVKNAGNLFYGDNKEVLAHLLANGYRGMVDLIYIDPPFDSAADYVRQVTLRGKSGLGAKFDGETYSLGEQVQYTDIWANDNYLQFMFERLILLKELLSENGTIWIHCDDARSHMLRLILDEVFGTENFLNSVTWFFTNKPQFAFLSHLPRDTNTLHVYAKQKGSHKFNHQYIANKRVRKQNVVTWDSELKKRVSKRDEYGNIEYRESTERLLGSMWEVPMVNPNGGERMDYPTQKPEELLEHVLTACSSENDLVLDCFIGSGTTAAVAQKLGRRWIGCDINKGAIQTTNKRIQGIIRDQNEARISAEKKAKSDLFGGEAAESVAIAPAAFSFRIHRVNDYDLAIQHNEAVALACEHIGVTRTKTDAYFDGLQGKRLVKIIPFNHPLSLTDLEQLKGELAARPMRRGTSCSSASGRNSPARRGSPNGGVFASGATCRTRWKSSNSAPIRNTASS